MRYLLNTLFVNSEDIYLSLDGENVVANRGKQRDSPLPAPYPLRYHFLLLCWRLSGSDGSLCPAR